MPVPQSNQDLQGCQHPLKDILWAIHLELCQLDRGVTHLTCSDSDHFVNRYDKDLPVPDIARIRRFFYRVDGALRNLFPDDDFGMKSMLYSAPR